MELRKDPVKAIQTSPPTGFLNNVYDIHNVLQRLLESVSSLNVALRKAS